MKLAEVLMDKMLRLKAERKVIKHRYESIDALLDRQAFNTISQAEINSLNEESEEIEKRITEIDEFLNSAENQLKNFLDFLKNDIIKLKEEKEKKEKRMSVLMDKAKDIYKNNKEDFRLVGCKREYDSLQQEIIEIDQSIKKRHEEINNIEEFISKKINRIR